MTDMVTLPRGVVERLIEVVEDSWDEYRDRDFQHERKTLDALRAALAQAAPPPAPAVPEGWVACSERMPESDEPVLIATVHGDTLVAWLDADMWLSTDGGFARHLSHVTHWMPLPPPPQQGETR